MTETIEKIRSKTDGRVLEEIRAVKRENAVLIPLVEADGEWSILFEVRAHAFDVRTGRREDQFLPRYFERL